MMGSNDGAQTSSLMRAQLGWAGTLTATWSLAGGAAGGMLIALFIITGRMHPEGALLFATALAVLGSLLGTIHGAVLGGLSRPAPHTAIVAPGDPITTALMVAGAFLVSIWIALWLALSAVLARAGNVIGWLAFAPLVALTLGIGAWATVLGWQAVERAYARWPEHRLGLRLVLGVSAVLIAVVIGLRPAIPGTELQLSTTASVIVAALVALWIATPAVIIGLRLARRRSTTDSAHAEHG